MIHLKISCKYLDSFLLNTIFFSRNKHILLHNCQTLYHKQKKKNLGIRSLSYVTAKLLTTNKNNNNNIYPIILSNM